MTSNTYTLVYGRNGQTITTTIHAPTISHALKLAMIRVPINTPFISLEKSRA